jgi:hypothetical protein
LSQAEGGTSKDDRGKEREKKKERKKERKREKRKYGIKHWKLVFEQAYVVMHH